MKKKISAFILVLVSLVGCSVLLAHEFWLMPSKFRVEPSEVFTLNFYVGEDFTGELWARRRERTSKFTHFSKSGAEDLTSLAIKSDSGDVDLKFNHEGTHLLAFETKNSFIALEADKFNAYLKDDGMDNIYELRKRTNTLNKKSREFYRRCAKTLIQVGNKTDNTFKKIIGTTLEIIPLKNPYSLTPMSEMSVQVLFEGKPLSDNLILVWNKTNGSKTRLQKLRTDTDGKIKFPLDVKGQWMVSLVRMVTTTDNSKADYQSIWADLTFEF